MGNWSSRSIDLAVVMGVAIIAIGGGFWAYEQGYFDELLGKEPAPPPPKWQAGDDLGKQLDGGTIIYGDDPNYKPNPNDPPKIKPVVYVDDLLRNGKKP